MPTNVRSIEYAGTRWIDIRTPTAVNLAELEEEFGFHPLLLEDLGSWTQRSKIDVYDECVYIVMHFPVHQPESRTNRAAEVDLIVGADFFITLHDGTLRPLVKMIDSVFDSPEVSVKLLEHTPSHLLYEVVDRLVDYCIPIVPRIEERIEHVEQLIFAEGGLKTVQEISYIRRDLISLLRILKPQLVIINRLERERLPFIHEEIDDYWGDIADHLGRVRDSLEDEKEIIDTLNDTHETLISYRMNEIIKTLTIISVVMLPLTLVAGIFGMNVPLPYQDSVWSYVYISGVMVALAVAMLLYFRRKRWM